MRLENPETAFETAFWGLAAAILLLVLISGCP